MYQFQDIIIGDNINDNYPDLSVVLHTSLIVIDDAKHARFDWSSNCDVNHAPAFYRARWLVKVTRHV